MGEICSKMSTCCHQDKSPPEKPVPFDVVVKRPTIQAPNSNPVATQTDPSNAGSGDHSHNSPAATTDAHVPSTNSLPSDSSSASSSPKHVSEFEVI